MKEKPEALELAKPTQFESVGDLKDLKKCYMDPNSYTNCDEMLTTHFHLNFTVDFDKQSLIGSNTLTVKALKDDVNSLILDYQGIIISGV